MKVMYNELHVVVVSSTEYFLLSLFLASTVKEKICIYVLRYVVIMISSRIRAWVYLMASKSWSTLGNVQNDGRVYVQNVMWQKPRIRAYSIIFIDPLQSTSASPLFRATHVTISRSWGREIGGKKHLMDKSSLRSMDKIGSGCNHWVNVT